MYIIQINKDTAEFIGLHFNNGATPTVQNPPTYYIVPAHPTEDFADIIDEARYLTIMRNRYDNPGNILIEKI